MALQSDMLPAKCDGFSLSPQTHVEGENKISETQPLTFTHTMAYTHVGIHIHTCTHLYTHAHRVTYEIHIKNRGIKTNCFLKYYLTHDVGK